MLISKRITVTISVLGITTAALYGAVAIPSILSIRDLRTKTAAEHAKIERRYALRDVMRNSLAGLESAKLHVAQLSSLAIKEGEELTFVNALEEAALEVGVEQDIVRVTGKNKVDVLHDLLTKPEFSKVLIFGRTKHGVEKLAKNLA